MNIYTVILTFIAAILLPYSTIKALMYYLNKSSRKNKNTKEKKEAESLNKNKIKTILIQWTKDQSIKNLRTFISKEGSSIYIEPMNRELYTFKIEIDIESISSYSRKGDILFVEKENSKKYEIDNRLTVLEYKESTENEQSIYFDSVAYEVLLELIPEKEIEAVKELAKKEENNNEENKEE